MSPINVFDRFSVLVTRAGIRPDREMFNKARALIRKGSTDAATIMLAATKDTRWADRAARAVA